MGIGYYIDVGADVMTLTSRDDTLHGSTPYIMFGGKPAGFDRTRGLRSGMHRYAPRLVPAGSAPEDALVDR